MSEEKIIIDTDERYMIKRFRFVPACSGSIEDMW